MSFPSIIYGEGELTELAAASDTKKHPLGTVMVLSDGRKFAYAKASAAITTVGLGIKNTLFQGVAYAAIPTAAALGATSVILTTAATAGAAGTGLIATDEFEGGYIVFFSAGVDIPQVRRITGNTSRIATGSLPVTFYIDVPLGKALTTSDHGECMQSPYSAVCHDTDVGHPVVGVATVAATSGQYLWLQTWGACFVSPQATVGIAGETACVFRHDGSLEPASTAVGANVTDQYAGHVLAESSTNTQAAPFIMLQIS